MGVFGSVVKPAPTFLAPPVSNDLHRSTIGWKPVGDDLVWPAVALHRTLQKLQRCLAIPPFRGKNFQHLPFVINGTPEVMCLAVDADENLVKMPAPT